VGYIFFSRVQYFLHLIRNTTIQITTSKVTTAHQKAIGPRKDLKKLKMQRENLKFVREVLTIVPMAGIKRDVVDLRAIIDAATIILIGVVLAEAILNLLF